MTPFLLFVLLVLVVALWMKWRDADGRLEEMARRLGGLESTLEQLKRSRTVLTAVPPPLPAEQTAGHPQPATLSEPEAVAQVPPHLAPPLRRLERGRGKGEEAPPDSGVQGGRFALEDSLTDSTARAHSDVPPVATPKLPRSESPSNPAGSPRSTALPDIQWESFLGVKLFAWVGGLALFLGIAFFVKYSFEHNLISPQMRVAIGYMVGFGLLAGALWMPRERHIVTVQTLCATGVLILYAVTFAAHAYYHFLGVPPAFAVMTLVTAAAFVLAVRLDAQVIAVLGLLGGFLTPPLLSTGVDNPLGLFGYLALLDIGLVAVLLRQRWNYLALLAAAATVLMQFGWVAKFFTEAKVFTGMTVFVGFAALFVGMLAVAHRLKRVNRWIAVAGLVMPAAALVFALYLLLRPYPVLAQRAWLLFGFVFLADVGFLIIAWLRSELRPAATGAGAGVFVLLAIWTVQFLTPELLNTALAFYLVFAALHAVFPLVLERLRPSTMPMWWIHLYPSLALGLILVPLFRIEAPSLLVWPVVLMIDLLAIVLAVMTASLASVLIVFLLTVLGTAAWIFQLPAELPSVSGMLIVIGGFAIFFMLAGLFAARKVLAGVSSANEGVGGSTSPPALTSQLFAQIGSLAALLPFLLLTLVLLRLPLANPSPVFGLAALLAVLWLAVVRWWRLDALSAVALLSVLLVEHVWHAQQFAPGHFGVAISWYLGFATVFFLFPFLFRKQMENRLVPWVTSALAWPAHFLLVYRSVTFAFPDFSHPGLVPAVFAVPCFVGLWRLITTVPAEDNDRLTMLAWFGGATLFFVTLIFPIQFERQWITLGWALEGAALLWLFHRVPHAGLRVVGVGLLIASFTRLALNPWVISEYGRTGTPILNWYLYSYGLVALCLMAGAWLLRPPRNLVLGSNAPPILFALGAVLVFFLVNIEIADYFSPRGQRLTFDFSASFAQDMAYSLAWALFAFALLAVGFKLKNAATRYAGVGLLLLTLLKLFLHDLWRLGGLYRIGSLVGLAVVLIVVSFIYQRFLSSQVAGNKEQTP